MVQIKAPALKRAVLPPPHLQLAAVHGLGHIDARIGQPAEMFFPPLGVDVMVSLVPVGETILDKRAKHAVLLIDVVEERTDMAILADCGIGKQQGIGGGFHIFTFTHRAPAHPTPAARPLSTMTARYSC